jgi:hypothetical protein
MLRDYAKGVAPLRRVLTGPVRRTGQHDQPTNITQNSAKCETDR